MLQALKLMLPALVSSWRFFDVIAPSPRVEYAILKHGDDTPKDWQEFRPRPVHLSFLSMLKRMIWNPEWNESLFLVSCAERIMAGSAEHAIEEIFSRIERQIWRDDLNISEASCLQFRLVFLYRDDAVMKREASFVSAARPLKAEAVHGV